MADYKKAMAKVLPIEGYIFNKKSGWVNDPDDSGKETIGGVARAYWPRWGGWPIVDAAKKLPNFPQSLKGNVQLHSLLTDFYYVNFWKLIGGDGISDQDFGYKLVCAAVNEGIKPAIRRAQQIVGLPQTGIADSTLVSKLNSIS